MRKQERGITLIALVITIIVLVILVGVTVSAAINAGLIQNSKTAVEDYGKEQQNEIEYLKKVELLTAGELAEGTTEDWEFDATTGTITGVKTTVTEKMVIPNYIDGVAVKKIETNIQGNLVIKEVIISEGIEVIGNYAFAGCGNLTSVSLPNSVTTIDAYAFENCRITNIVIPGSVKVIGSGAFLDSSSLTSITLENGVEIIGSGAFYGSGLREVYIPKSVKSIGSDAFASGPTKTLTIQYGTELTTGSANHPWGAETVNFETE